MKKIVGIISSFALMLSMTLAVATPAFADPVDVFKGDACKGNTSVCGTSGSTGVYTILKNVVNVLLTIGGIIAVIMIIVGGIKYTTSTGDSGSVNSARETIIYAVVGLVVSIMAFAIVNFVLNRL
jgi:Type IV secretion system pilin